MASAFASSGSLNAAAKIILSTANSNAESLVSSGKYFYVLNNGTTKNIYRYTKTGSGALASKAMLTNTGTALSSVTGLVIDGSYLRIVDKGLDRTLKYSISSLFSAAGSLNASTNNALNSANTNATGITITTSSNILKVDSENPLEEIAKSEFDLLIYPNPSSSNITVHVDGVITGNLNIQIYNLFGKLIFEKMKFPGENNPAEIDIDLSSLSAGKYIVRVNDDACLKTKIIEHY